MNNTTKTPQSATTSGTSTTSNPAMLKQQMQQIIDGLNQLRSEQRQLAHKVADIEGDINEHRLVIEQLKLVPPERKCFRMVGGVLIEHNVQAVLPDLERNHEMLKQTVESYNAKIDEKANQISDYVKQHNLVGLLRTQNDLPEESTSTTDMSKQSVREAKPALLASE